MISKILQILAFSLEFQKLFSITRIFFFLTVGQNNFGNKIPLIIIQVSLFTFFSILLLCNRFKHSGTYFTLCQRRGHSFISQFSHQLGQWNVWCRIGYPSQSSKYYVEWRTGPNWIYFFGQNGYPNAGRSSCFIKAWNSILLHSGLNPAWYFWLSTRFSCCLKMKSVENILGYIREEFEKL